MPKARDAADGHIILSLSRSSHSSLRARYRRRSFAFGDNARRGYIYIHTYLAPSFRVRLYTHSTVGISCRNNWSIGRRLVIARDFAAGSLLYLVPSHDFMIKPVKHVYRCCERGTEEISILVDFGTGGGGGLGNWKGYFMTLGYT